MAKRIAINPTPGLELAGIGRWMELGHLTKHDILVERKF